MMPQTSKFHFMIIAAAFALISCGKQGQGGAPSWAESGKIQSASAPGAQAAVISDAYFNPDVVAIDRDTYDGSSTLNFYAQSIETGREVIAIVVSDPSGSEKMTSVTSTPSVPGWLSVSVDTGGYNPGTYSYSVWLLMADGSVSNKLTASVTLIFSSGAGEDTIISNAYFSPNPADVSQDSTETQVTLHVHVQQVRQGAQVVSLWVRGGYYNESFQFAVTTQPEPPEWISQDMYLSNVSGKFTYSVFLELNDGTISNIMAVDVVFLPPDS